MSRWTKDPERAAGDLIRRSLDAIGLSGRVLLANQACHLSPMLAERGTKVCACFRAKKSMNCLRISLADGMGTSKAHG